MGARFTMGVLACALALGCSDASDPATVDSGTGNGDAGGNPGDGGGPPIVGARTLEIVGQSAVAAGFDSMVQLQVLYRGVDAPVRAANLEATMADEQGNDVSGTGFEGTILAGRRVATGDDGIATFTVNTGGRAANVRVQISAPEVSPVTFAVTVLREGTGGISVRVVYDENVGRYAYADLSAAQVHLFDVQDCATLRASATNLQGAYFSLGEIAPFNEVDNAASAGELDENATFQVAATATNAAGGVVAFGCVDGFTITGGEVKQLDVNLEDLRLEFKGTYKVVHRFDLTDMLANTENSTLATVGTVLNVLRLIGDGSGERGQALVELICQFAEISPATCDLLDSTGGRVIDEVIGRLVPANVLRIFTILSDVITIFTDLTVVGEIQLDTLGADGVIAMNDNRWQKFRWTWNDGCPDGENCTREFALGDLQVNDRPIFGTFDATLNGSILTINGHGISFRYGLIILEMAQNWVIPRLLDPPSNERVTVEEMLAAIIPCAAINEGITGDPNDDICELVIVASLAEIINDQLSALEFNANEFTISGSVTPVDSDGDLAIDLLSMGAWSGQLAITDPPLVFGGCFEGCRPAAGGDCEPAACDPQ